jgi:NADH:ubiquinone oxidoreductase subunit 5 (subunit L)/multisubunit Na+/H+ antiporter MnhA subunit
MQKDMKKLVAYSSVSHLGFCTLGIFALNSAGLTGSVLQQINHGISTGALFLIVGILYERRHTREIAEYGGISNVMPIYATITMIMFLSSMGLAAAEWLRRRIHDFAGSLHGELEVGGLGGAGRGSGGGLPCSGSISACSLGQ